MVAHHLLGLPFAPAQASALQAAARAGLAAMGAFSHRTERTTSGDVYLPSQTLDGYVYLTMCGGGGGVFDNEFARTATDGGDTTVNGTLLIARGGKAGGSNTGTGEGNGGDAVCNIPGFVFTARGAKAGTSQGSNLCNGEELYGAAFGGGRGGVGNNTSGLQQLPTLGRRLHVLTQVPNGPKVATAQEYTVPGGGSLEGPRWNFSGMSLRLGRGGGTHASGTQVVYAGGGAGSFYRFPIPLASLPAVLSVVVGAGGLKDTGNASGSYYNGEDGFFRLEWNEA